jgi:hypothetical protein
LCKAGVNRAREEFDAACKVMRMNGTIDQMKASDWEQVRLIYLEGIRSGNSTFETDAPS